MSDLVLRPSWVREDVGRPYALQLRKHESSGPTDYHTLAYVSREIADEIIGAGKAFWLFGEPKEAKDGE